MNTAKYMAVSKRSFKKSESDIILASKLVITYRGLSTRTPYINDFRNPDKEDVLIVFFRNPDFVWLKSILKRIAKL